VDTDTTPEALKMEESKSVIPDVEPVAMSIGSEYWIHPYMKSWWVENWYEGMDNDVHLFTIENSRGNVLLVMFKSTYADGTYKRYFNDTESDDSFNKHAIYEPPYLNCNAMYDTLKVIITEDVWHHRPNVEFEIKNSRDYAKFLEMYPSEQCCFTEFGEQVSEFFADDEIKWSFTSDCGLWLDEDNKTWGYDT